MVLINHNKNINRIISVIENDPNSFDPENSDDDKLRVVAFGDPPNGVYQNFEMPCAYITTATDLQESTPQIGVSISNNVKSVTVEYQIIVVSHNRESQANSQKQLYDLIKNIRALTEADPLFSDPQNSGTDPIFIRSIISNVRWVEKQKDQLVTVITMTLLATIGALFFLIVPGISNPIPLISKPVDRDTDSVEDILDDTLTLKDTAVIKSKRTITAEFESTTEITLALRTIKDGRESNSFTIKSPTGDEIITSYVTQLASSTGFSNMETSIIQLEVINP